MTEAGNVVGSGGGCGERERGEGGGGSREGALTFAGTFVMFEGRREAEEGIVRCFEGD